MIAEVLGACLSIVAVLVVVLVICYKDVKGKVGERRYERPIDSETESNDREWMYEGRTTTTTITTTADEIATQEESKPPEDKEKDDSKVSCDV